MLHTLLFILGLVLGRIQRHPVRSLRALAVCLGRAVVIALRFSQHLVGLLWRVWRGIDGPVARALALVMGLIVLANLLASSSALAGWATVFIVGAFRGLTGLLRRGHPTSRHWQSATPAAIPVPAPFDAGRSASLPPSR